MQCPACGFQNLPGLEQCARCLSLLVLDGVNVQPFRASDRGAWWRRLRARLRRHTTETSVFRRVREALGQRLRLSRSSDEPGIPFRVACAFASLIPGLGHFLSGRRGQGLLIFFGYLLLLLMGFMLMASWTGPVFIGLAAALHTYAVISSAVYRMEFVSIRFAFGVGLLVFLIVQYVLYPAVGHVAGNVARFEGIQSEILGTSLVEGDVVLIEGRWLMPSHYKRGDLVIYDIPESRGDHFIIRAGQSIDAILAGPGDHLVSRKGFFYVNGEPVPPGYAPAPQTVPDGFDMVLGTDDYFIYPTAPSLQGHWGNNNRLDLLARMHISVVPQERIHGRVRMIVSPPTRWRRL